LYRGPIDPESLSAGARGHVSWRADQVGWVKDPTRPSFTGAGDRRRPGGGGTRAWEEEGERVLRDRKLTKNPPRRLPWPETGRRWCNRRRRSRISAEETATTSVIQGAGLRFLLQGGRGRRGGPSQCFGGARGGTERWR
jgi:hypothetical protein